MHSLQFNGTTQCIKKSNEMSPTPLTYEVMPLGNTVQGVAELVEPD